MRRDPNHPEVSSGELTRRDFLQNAAAGVLGATVLPQLASLARTPVEMPAKLGVQLYSVRDALKTDLNGTLKRLAAMGFAGVETAFFAEGVTLQRAGRALKDAGLTVSSAHVELPIGDKRQVMLDTAKAFNTTRVIWHGWPEDLRYRSIEGTTRLAAIYNQSNRIAKDNGLKFGLHNHWWEYRTKVSGKYVYEVLLEQLDPDIFFEVDTYWAKVAGQDPAAIVAKLGARAQLLHIKDGPAVYNDRLAIDSPDPMTAVGKGTLNIPAIARAAAGHADWMIVEIDNTEGDVFTALQESYNYLAKNSFARGTKPATA